MKITIELDTDKLTPEQLTAVCLLIPAPVALSPKTIKRADLRLKEGDSVMLRNGEGPFICASRGGLASSVFPFDIGDQFLTREGRFCGYDAAPHQYDAISVNGAQIEDTP